MKGGMKACVEAKESLGDAAYEPTANPALRAAIKGAKAAMLPLNYIQRVMQFARQGFTEIDFKTSDTDWNSAATLTVPDQNSHTSVRLSDDFLRTVAADGEWTLN